MNGLHPIIRRKRRPLVEENPQPVKMPTPKTAEEKAITEQAETVKSNKPSEDAPKK